MTYDRFNIVLQAMHSIEELSYGKVSEDTKADVEDYLAGNISSDELVEIVRNRYNLKEES